MGVKGELSLGGPAQFVRLTELRGPFMEDDGDFGMEASVRQLTTMQFGARDRRSVGLLLSLGALT